MRRTDGFTLIELLTAVTIIAVLAALSLNAASGLRKSGYAVTCAASLRQLGCATQLYASDHDQKFFPYRTKTTEGTQWYFGLENGTTWVNGEQQRNLDVTSGPLFPYTLSVGGIEICHAFDYGSALWKPKFKGASWGYGYNYALGGGATGTLPLKSLLDLAQPSQVIIFGDCAQVNTFQSPASVDHPMVEEFYIIENQWATIHFRHNGRANLLFADGHVEAMKPWPGTVDSRLSVETVGRISPVGSTQYLQ